MLQSEWKNDASVIFHFNMWVGWSFAHLALSAGGDTPQTRGESPRAKAKASADNQEHHYQGLLHLLGYLHHSLLVPLFGNLCFYFRGNKDNSNNGHKQIPRVLYQTVIGWVQGALHKQ